MGWDYLDDSTLYKAENLHYWESDRWETIDIELEAHPKIVSLTRKEWKQLQGFLAKYEFENITRQDYAHLPDKLKTILNDWLRNKL